MNEVDFKAFIQVVNMNKQYTFYLCVGSKNTLFIIKLLLLRTFQFVILHFWQDLLPVVFEVASVGLNG